MPDWISHLTTPGQNRPTYDTVTGEFSPVSTLMDSHKIGGKAYVSKEGTPEWLQPSTEYLGDAGESVYDKNLSRQNVTSKDEFRGENQPAIAKLGAGLMKAIVNTGTTAADGIIGTAVGLANMGVEDKTSAFWDNPFSNLMNDINNDAEKWFPNYYTEQEKNASFIGQLGYANFWGDKFLKNLGTVAGMVLDGVITGGGSMELLGGKAVASKLPEAIAAAAIKGDKALGMAVQANDMLGLSTEIINNAKKLNTINKVSQGLSSVLSAQGMSRFMAIDNSTRFYTENYQKLNEQLSMGVITRQQYENKLVALKEASEGYGNADFLANTIVMGIGSGVQFKNLFTKGFTPTKAIAEGIHGSIAKGYTYTRPAILDAAKIAKNILASSGMFQEQYAASLAVSDFYQKKFDTGKQGTVDDIYHSIYKGLTDAYGTREGWNQGLLGSIIGALGVPTITRKGPGWGGGILGDVREVRERNIANENATKHLNDVLKSEDFKNNYQSLIRNLVLEDEKNLVAVQGDKYEVLNKQHDQFINDALQFIRANKYEDFVNNIKAVRNSNGEEVKQLFRKSTLEDNIRGFYGLKPKALEGHVFEKYTADEVTDKLNESANKMLNSVKTIKDLYDAYSIKYPNISEAAKEQLIYTASKLEDVNDRINDLNRESMSKYGLNINDHVNIKEDGEIDLSEYNEEYKKIVADQRLTGKFSPVDAEEFKKNIIDLPRLIRDKLDYTDLYKYITTNKGIKEVEAEVIKQDEQREKENIGYEPTIEDQVTYTNPDGETRTYRVNQIDEDNNVVITPIDEQGNPTGEADIITDKANIKLYTKEGKGKKDLEESSLETMNWDEIPDIEKKLYEGPKRGLKEVSSALSHSNWDDNQNKTIVRNKEFDTYVSNPENDLKADQIQFHIDTSLGDEHKEKVWKQAKLIKDKLDKGEKFTKKEIDNIIKSRKLTGGEDNFNSIVDILPIKASYITNDGEVFDNGLYYHDSGYNNIYIPKDVNPEEYVVAQMERTRANRAAILTVLLSGNDVTITSFEKTVGIPNNTNVNRLIDEVLKQDANTINLGIGLGTGNIWTGHDTPDMKGVGGSGSIFIETSKTCNGKLSSIHCNVSKLSPEHAGILWTALVTRVRKGFGARQALYPNEEEVKNLTVGQVIDLLVTFGIGTDIKHPDNVGKTHLEDKQLFIDSKLNLHYGKNIVDLHDVLKGNIDRNIAREKFVDWATKNKNYRVAKEIPELGIQLNKPMKKVFTLGSWVSDGSDTYSGSIIKNGLVKTNVVEFEDTGSLFHAPVTIMDMNSSGLKIKPTKEVISEAKDVIKTIDNQSKKESNNPKNTGTKKIESVASLTVKPEELEKLRSLPIGTEIYTNIVQRVNEAEEVRNIPTLYVSIVDNKGKKGFRIENVRARTAFDISIESYEKDPNPIVEVNDESITKLSNLLTKLELYGTKFTIDTSKSKTVEKPKVKETISKVRPEEPIIEDKLEKELRIIELKGSVISNEERNSLLGIDVDFLLVGYSTHKLIQHINGKIVSLEKGPTNIDITFKVNLDNGDSFLIDQSGYVYTNNNVKFVNLSKEELKLKKEDISLPKEEDEGISGLRFTGDPINDIDMGDDAPFKLTETEPVNYKVTDIKKELKWLHDKLGDVPVELREGLIDVAKSGKKAFGQLSKDGVVLSKLASEGTVYHEAFHRVSLLYLDPVQREGIYREARTKYKDEFTSTSTDKDIEENLAEKFKEYVQTKEVNPEHTLLGKIGQFFQNLYHLVKRIFTGPTRLTNLDIDKLFSSIQSDKFRTYKPLQDNLDRLGFGTYELEYRDKKLDNIINFKMFRSIVKGLSNMAMSDVSKKLFEEEGIGKSKYSTIDVKDSIQSVNFKDLKDKIKKIVDDFNEHANENQKTLDLIEKQQLTPELASQLKARYKVDSISTLTGKARSGLKNALRLANLYQEVYDNYDTIYKEAIEDYLYSELGIRRIYKDGEDERVSNKEIVDYDKESYQISAKDNIANSIKFLLHNLHESNEKDPNIGLRKFAEFDEVWSRVINDLHDQDTVEDMIRILDNIKDYYPYQQLATKLKSRTSDNIRTQFYESVKKHRHSFVNVMFKEIREKGQLPNFSIYFTNADVQNAANNAVRTWGEVFALSGKVQEDKLNKEKLDEIYTKYNKLIDDYRSALSSKALVNTNEYKDRLIDSLKDINIEIDNKTIDNLINDIIKSGKAGTEELALKHLIDDRIYNGLFSSKSTLYKYAEGSKENKYINLEPKTLFRNESIVKDLARSYAKTNYENISDNVSGAGGNNHYVFSENTYITDIIHNLKTDSNFLKNLQSDIYAKYSHFLPQLNNKLIRDNVKIDTFNAFIEDGTGDQGRDYLKISPVEDFMFKLALTRSGYTIFPILAGRRTYPILEGLDRTEVRYQKTTSGELRIPDEIIDIFYKYAQAEKNKIDKALETVKKYSELDDKGNIVKVNDFRNLVENYHYKVEGERKVWKAGLAHKYQHMFETFNRKGFKLEVDGKDEIRDILKNNIDETIEYAKDNGIIFEDKNGKLASRLIDKDVINEVAKFYGGDVDSAIRSIIADYTVNTKISSIEAMMLFTGDVSFYKPDNRNNPADDYAKRLSLLGSTGTTPRDIIPGEDEDPNYSVTTINDQEYKSRYYQQIYDKQKELLLPKYNNDETLVDKILKTNLRKYTEVDPSDAMVWISPEMYKRDQVKRGKWDGKKEEAFQLLQSDQPIPVVKEQELLNISMNPLKHLYYDRVKYDIDDNNKLFIPTQDKMCMFTLHRRYVKDSYLEDLLDRMEAKGKYVGLEKIHMVKTNTAVKVGGRLRGDFINNSDTPEQSVSDLSNLVVYSQQFKFLRNLQTTDPHEVQKVLVASQFKKILQANIDDTNDYNVKGYEKPIKGSDLKKNITKALCKLSDKEMHRLLDKLGVDENGKMNTDLFYNTLLNNAKVSGMPENVKETLRRKLSIDILPERKWITQRFASEINKHGIDLHLPGQQLIQMSGFGSGLKSVTDQSNNLRFLFDDKGKITGSDARVSVQVFKDIIPDYINKTYEEKVKWLKSNPDVIEGIGYRIPNQGQNSSIFLKINDFLPESSGDVIMLPNEFTTLTGSDFDVDKVFFVRFNYKTSKDGSISKVPFYTDNNSTIDQRYDRLLNEAFYDNKFRFTKESYVDLEEARNDFYGSLDWKNRLLGEEDGNRLSTLFDLRKQLSKNLKESTIDSEKQFHHKMLVNLDNKIDDILYYNNLIKENDELLKDYKDIIEQTLVKNKLFLSREEFKKQHSEGKLDYFDQNTKQSIQNHYLEHCKSIMLSDHHFLSTSAPLSAVTGRFKRKAEQVIKSEETGKEKSFDFTNPVYQAQLKHKFASGGLGKAAFSLSNSSHIETQLANVSFKKDIGIGIKDGLYTSLHEHYGKPEGDGQKVLISDLGSALIDSHVDIEKDPYIIDLNVVKPTYNVEQLAIRVGEGGDKTSEFMSQPILKDFSKASINEDGEIGVGWEKPMNIIRDKWIQLYNKSLKDSKITKGDIDNQLKDYNPFEDNLLKVLQTPVKDAMWYAKQLKILQKFNELDKGPAKDLNKLVMVSRVGTKKWGTNLTEAKMYIDSVKELYKDNPFTNLDKLLPYDPETNIANDVEGGSFNSAYLRNGPLMFMKLMADRTITATKPFNDLIDKIVDLSKNKYAKNKEGLLNHIADELHAAFLSRFFTDSNLLNLDSKKVSTTIGNVIKFLSDVNEGEYREKLKDNVLIQSLLKGRETKDGLTFFGIPTIKADDNFVKEDLTFAWQDLLQSNDPKLNKFAKELFVYSFYTSGFKRGLYSIFHYIPPSMFDELEISYTKEDGTKTQDILNFSDFADGLLSTLNDPMLVNTIVDGLDKEVFKNNWYNPKYVPQASESEVQSIITTTKTKQPVVASIYRRNQYGYQDAIGVNKFDEALYKPYVLYKVDENTSYLMEYIGYHGNDKSPIYKVVEKRGYYNKGRVIKEYGLDKTMFKRNEVKEFTDDKILETLRKDPMYDDIVYIPEEYRELAVNKRSKEEVESNEGLDKKKEITSLDSEKESIRKEVLESGDYTDKQSEELNKMIDDTNIKSIEDINDLIKRICDKFMIPRTKLTVNNKNRYSIND